MFQMLLTVAWITIAGSSRTVIASACPADINADTTVNVQDLLAVISSWGEHNATHTIAVTNFQFDPNRLQAKTGDEIRWTYEFGLHTVTSGGSCSGDGRFNVVISPSAPEFSYALSPDEAGTLEYYCEPHCGVGMSGSIDIAPFATDLTGDGTVNVADLLAVIQAWGACL